MIIKNKLESVRLIKELNLNKLPEETFKKNEEDKVISFLNKYPANLYAIRDKTQGCGIFKFKVPKDQVLNEIKDYNLYSINISSANYSTNQLLVGEIEILSNDEVYATLTTNKDASVRDAIIKPEFNIKTTIFDKVLNKIPCFDIVYKYIIDNGLKDVIVEFSLFDIPLGINNEDIVIYEIRTDY